MKASRILKIACLPLLLTATLLYGGQAKLKHSTSGTKTNLQVAQCPLKVKGMVCGGCAAAVKEGVLKLEGINAATVDDKTGKVQVTYDPKKTNPEKILAAFNKQPWGFRAELAQSGARNSSH